MSEKQKGNVGIIVSPKLFAELRNVLGGRVIFQGVNDYAADIPYVMNCVFGVRPSLISFGSWIL